MATGLLDVIKRAALDAVENNKPCDLRYGTVVSESPLSIMVTNQFVLPESILIVPEHLTDYEIKITTTGYGWETDNKAGGAGQAEYESHKHAINQTERTVKVHGKLKAGDKVALLRQTGGQFYYILDRLPKE